MEGERDAAVNRGTAIAEKAGLSLDLFDVPGRFRPPPGPTRRVDYFDLDLFDIMVDSFRRDPYSTEAVREAAEAVRDEIARRAPRVCRDCKGSGVAPYRQVRGVICRTCSGSGKVPL